MTTMNEFQRATHNKQLEKLAIVRSAARLISNTATVEFHEDDTGTPFGLKIINDDLIVLVSNGNGSRAFQLSAIFPADPFSYNEDRPTTGGGKFQDVAIFKAYKRLLPLIKEPMKKAIETKKNNDLYASEVAANKKKLIDACGLRVGGQGDDLYNLPASLHHVTVSKTIMFDCFSVKPDTAIAVINLIKQMEGK